MTGSEQTGERETHIPDTSLNVYQRHLIACQVIDSMPWIKDQSNPQYKSVPIDAMRAGVRKACIAARIVHRGPSQMDYTREVEIRKDKNGMEVGKTFRYYGEAKFHLINVDNPDDIMEWEVVGEAMDTGDKGFGKLESAFIKNFYKAAFDIGEKGEDNDSYSNEEFEQFLATKRAESERAHAAAERGKADEDEKHRIILANLETPTVKAYIDKHGKDLTQWPILDVYQCVCDIEEKEGKSASSEFRSGEEIKNAEISGTIIPTEQEMASFIDVCGAMPAYKKTVKGFKQSHGAMSSYDLSYDEKVELYTILKDMGAVQ